MNEKEREVLDRLRQGEAPKPPAGLLERLKADVPERLPTNVRPFRRRVPAAALRIAAALFVVSGAVLVVSRGLRRGVVPGVPEERAPQAARQAEPSYPMAAPAAEVPRSPEPVDGFAAPRKPAAPAPVAAQAPAPREEKQAKQEKPSREASLDDAKEAARAEPRRNLAEKEERDEQTGRAFAPSMPAARAKEPEPAKAAPQAAEDRAAARADAPAPPPAVFGYTSTSGAPAGSGAVRQEAAGARDAETAPAPKLTAKKALASRGRAIAPTTGSLLAELFATPPAAATTRSGDRRYLLLSVPRGAEAPLEPGARVLSAAELRDGSTVVLASAPAGAEEEGLASAPADLRLALLAHRLERANAAGDASDRAAVAREARELVPRDARAAILVRLATR